MSVYVKIQPTVDIFEKHYDAKGDPFRHKARSMSMFDVVDWLTNDAHFSKPAKLGKVAAEILSEFEGKAAGEFVKLTSDQYGHLKQVLDNQSAPFPAVLLKQIVPHIDALLEPLSEEQFRKQAAPPGGDQ